MANKKFSDFDLKTNSSDVAFVVGFNGSDNVRIAPSNLVVGTTPGGSDTQIQFNNSGAFGAGSFLTTNKSNNLEVAFELGLKGDGGSNQGLLKLYCEAGTAHHVGIKGPLHSGGSSYTLQLPNALPNVANQILESNASGALSWIATPSGAGGVTSIVAGTGISVNQSTGAVTVSASGGGGGASDLNGLSDCLVSTQYQSQYIGNVPANSTTAERNVTLGFDAGNSITNGNNNVFLGYYAAFNSTWCENAVAIGERAAQSNVNRHSFVAIGYLAAQNNTTNMTYGTFVGREAGKGSSNNAGAVCIGMQSGLISAGEQAVAVGQNAGRNNTVQGTVSVGYQAGYNQTTGANNTQIGFNSGFSNTTSGYRTMLGYEAGKSHTGMFSTGIGMQALKAGSGMLNVAVGSNSMKNNSGSRSVAVGHQSMLGCTAADDCVAIGVDTLTSSNAGDYNIAIGTNSLQQCTSDKNTAVGYDSAKTLTSGENNVAIGYQAASSIGTGFQNVAIGAESLKNGVNKFGNTVIGYLSGQYAAANLNTFVGKEAGRGSSSGTVSGFANVVVGGSAYNNFTTGSGNVVLGYQALINGVHTGSNNIFVGRDILNGTAFTGSNSMAIGYVAAPSSGSVSNEITLGNSSITALRCAVTSITSLSDERDKSEIKDLEYGLAFIDALQPREFVWNNRPETKKETDENGNETEVEFNSANKGKKDFGFIAQEVQELDNETLRLVYSENEEKLELSYGKLVPILVKAIQELKEEVELLKAK
ncbi:MAG: hypothetical protein CML73_01325 [Rhodobiaceae bacterium]|nr:hypothetical protein [Rhodobiaceae bacterium]